MRNAILALLLQFAPLGAARAAEPASEPEVAASTEPNAEAWVLEIERRLKEEYWPLRSQAAEEGLKWARPKKELFARRGFREIRKSLSENRRTWIESAEDAISDEEGKWLPLVPKESFVLGRLELWIGALKSGATQLAQNDVDELTEISEASSRTAGALLGALESEEGRKTWMRMNDVASFVAQKRAEQDSANAKAWKARADAVDYGQYLKERRLNTRALRSLADIAKDFVEAVRAKGLVLK